MPTFQIEVGRYKGSYFVRWTFDKEGQAILYYNGLNVGYGYKKRLRKDGKIIAREIS